MFTCTLPIILSPHFQFVLMDFSTQRLETLYVNNLSPTLIKRYSSAHIEVRKLARMLTVDKYNVTNDLALRITTTLQPTSRFHSYIFYSDRFFVFWIPAIIID